VRALLTRPAPTEYHCCRRRGWLYIQDDVNEYVFRYNHRNEAAAIFEAVDDRSKKVHSGLGKAQGVRA